jgi:HEPN domain-containing protein
VVDTKRYKEWLIMAEKDLKSAKILFEHDADYGALIGKVAENIGEN